MKEICVWAVGFVMLLFSLRYIYLIKKQKISPALSTWVVFLLGTILSLVTYAIAEDHDFRSGILNTVDVASVSIIIIAIIIYRDKNRKIKPFDRWYMIGIGLIVLYGFLSKDAWNSNIFTQILIGVGYIPTFQKLISEKKNTESFSTWSLSILSGVIAFYPAIVDGNSLAIIYATRAIIIVSLLMLTMLYFEIYSKRKLVNSKKIN
ncbi:MAG: hypothetical protein WC908_01715 [Candidatus Paceibacterota bacterium]